MLRPTRPAHHDRALATWDAVAEAIPEGTAIIGFIITIVMLLKLQSVHRAQSAA